MHSEVSLPVLFGEKPLWAGLNPYQIVYRVTMANKTQTREVTAFKTVHIMSFAYSVALNTGV